MQASVDMSGRIEETNKPTALALANGLTATLRMEAREKLLVISEMQRRSPDRERKHIHVYFFSNLLYLLLRDHLSRLQLVVIDVEYPGYEAVIKNRVLTLCRNHGLDARPEQLTFGRVGDNGMPAHEMAYSVFKGQRAAERRVSAEEELGLFKR